MNIFLYTLFCYGITAAISYIVIALVIFISKVMSKPNNSSDENN
ncbi:hypothetical protein [Gilliamella sp. wkB108]|nr:hypothetical protein [Gilliamella apicola]